MKKLILVALSVNALLLAGLFWQQFPVARGGQQICIVNGDCNGDGVRDLTDAVYFLTWFFRGGPAPVPCDCEPVPCGGLAGIPCDVGQFCDLPAGLCNAADLVGECKPVPLGCPDIVAPVCGCDGVTYGNDCERQMAGAQLDHTGSCSTLGDPCGGIAGIPCSAGLFCDFPAGQCNVADPNGVCVTVPPACTAVFDPVCGCDGMTYGNDCERKKAQVPLDHTGPCP